MIEDMKKLIVASGNRGKLKEIAEILRNRYDVVPMAEAGYTEDVEETGNTFYENALLKATAVSEALGCDALADDSGLCVDALNGAPGVFSARFAGEHGDDAANRRLLLDRMEGVTDRRARFVSYVVLRKADGTVVVGRGETSGTILLSEEGANGFGYDSLFLSDDLGKSFGVASAKEKNAVSHRYRALCDLEKKL